MSFRFLAASLVLSLGAGCGVEAEPEAALAAEADLTLDELPIRMTDIAEGTFDQAIDHAPDGAALGTFKQRYWYSTQFAKGKDAPVIFYFCPEGPCSAFHLASLGDTAKTLGAATVALEHRYYGRSLPFVKPTVGQMKYLTIHNALEDAASFEGFAKTQLGLSGKWIAVGGSYPGMLATFYRATHPELVVGAWASSAPVDMVEAFSGYDEITAHALGPECAARFRAALVAVELTMAEPDAWAAMSTRIYGAPRPLPSAEDEAAYRTAKGNRLLYLSVFAMTAAQSGTPGPLCAALAQHADAPVDGLIGFVRPPLVAEDSDPAAPIPVTATGPGSLDTSGTADPAAQPAGDDRPYTARTWDYQECTEVGFFKVASANREQSIMPALIDIETWRAQCDRNSGRQPKVAETRAKYLDPILSGKVTNLFFVNGDRDPWSALSFPRAGVETPAGITTHIVAHGSHMSDLMNLSRFSALGVFEAHVKFNQLAKQWLAE